VKRLLLFSLALGLFLAGCSLAGDITPPPGMATVEPVLQPTTAPTAEPTQVVPASAPKSGNGAQIYVAKCLPCHGQAGLGDGSQADNLPFPPTKIGDPAISNQARPVDWYAIVTEGNLARGMPGFTSLSEGERWEVVAYALTLSMAEEAVAHGEEIYQDLCAECHGLEGAGMEESPALTEGTVLIQMSGSDLFDVISMGLGESMPAFDEDLSEADRWDLVAYLRSQTLTVREEAEQAVEALSEEDTRQGTIRGQVINGTQEGVVPTGLMVTLHGFEGPEEVLTESAEIDAAGAFEFTEVEQRSGWLFVVTAEYENTLYGSEVAHMSGEQVLELPLRIYETTPSLDAARVDRLHVILNTPAEGILQVAELWVFSNLGDRTIRPLDGEGGLRISLPDEAVNLQFEGSLGEQIIRSEDGFTDQTTLRPGMGTHQLVFSFELPYDGKQEFNQTLAYPINAAIILAPESGPELKGDQVEDLGLREFSGGSMRTYQIASISPGEPLHFQVSGYSAIPGTAPAEESSKELLIGVGVLVVGAVLAGFLWFRRSQAPEKMDQAGIPTDPAMGRELSLTEEQDSLAKEIAELDDAFSDGEIAEGTYRALRAELKGRLLDILAARDDQG
jgi:mono/diheme cytochrome c family protein